MSNVDSALYSPYGAYELKSKYQRNFTFATLSALGFVLVILSVYWISLAMEAEEDFSNAPG